MKYIADYKREHRELAEMINVLKGLLQEDQFKLEANARLVHERLCNLAEKVQRHLSDEDKELYPSLLVHEDPEVKNIAWGYVSGESHLRKEFGKYARRWLKNPVLDFSIDYIQDTNEMLDFLTKRIDKEEHVLFPKLVQAGVESSRSKPMIDLVDVLVHIDESLDHDDREALVEKVREEDGVISVSLHEKRAHLMMVEYDPQQTTSSRILARVNAQGVHAELVGL